MGRGSKYQAIGEYLANRKQERVRLTYNEIDTLCPLPATAYSDRSFWANTWVNSQARGWLERGYVVADREVKLGEFVVFQYDPKRAKDPGQRRKDSALGKHTQTQRRGGKRAFETLGIARPCANEVEKYLKRWEKLPKYPAQEKALEKLFSSYPRNIDLSDVLLKATVLNVFYSTNIFDITPVAEHILTVRNVDLRLQKGDLTLVDDLQKVEIGEKARHPYSFATKYCSHHQPELFPIFDGYVEKMLCYFRNVDGLFQFRNHELRNYSKFCEILGRFREAYGLQKYNVKDVDKYLWQLGKKYFPKAY